MRALIHTLVVAEDVQTHFEGEKDQNKTQQMVKNKVMYVPSLLT